MVTLGYGRVFSRPRKHTGHALLHGPAALQPQLGFGLGRVRGTRLVVQPLTKSIAECDAGFAREKADAAVTAQAKAFAAFRRLCGLAKADAAADLLEMELDSGALPKVVVFAHHSDVVERVGGAALEVARQRLGRVRRAVLSRSATAEEGSQARFQHGGDNGVVLRGLPQHQELRQRRAFVAPRWRCCRGGGLPTR